MGVIGRECGADFIIRNNRQIDEKAEDAGEGLTPEASSALPEAGVQSQVSTAVLKKTLAIDAAEGEDMVKMMGQGSRFDQYA